MRAPCEVLQWRQLFTVLKQPVPQACRSTALCTPYQHSAELAFARPCHGERWFSGPLGWEVIKQRYLQWLEVCAGVTMDAQGVLSSERTWSQK